MPSVTDQVHATLQLRASPPAVPPGFMPRNRLSTALTEGAAGPVTLVSAGPGYGKTLTVARWARGDTTPGPVAWLAADKTDNTVAAFWADVLGALTLAEAVELDSPLRDLEPATGFGAPEVLRITAALAQSPTPVVLVIDDLHRIGAEEVLDSLGHLLAHQPEQLRLVLLTRSEPTGLHLHRLRVSGALTEIRFADLAFTRSEVEQLCTSNGIDLSSEQSNALVGLIQGWPAALRLALLGIDPTDVAAGLARFTGDDRVVTGYLLDEIVNELRPDDRRFLRATSVVERVSGPLAHALTDRSDSRQLLESLVERNALVVRLGGPGDWFSIHPLLRQVLSNQLASEPPDVAAELHRRAARWFAATGDAITAIRHWGLAGEWAEITRLLAAVALPLMLTPHASALAAALAPAEAEANRQPTSDTLLAAAFCHFKRRNYVAMLRDAEDAEQQSRHLAADDRQDTDLLIAVVRMAHARARHPARLVPAATDLLRLLDQVPRQRIPAVDAYTLIATNNAAIGQLQAGLVDRAATTLVTVEAHAAEAGLGLIDLTSQAHLALLDVIQGWLPDAHRRAAAAAQFAERRGWRAEPQALAMYAAAALTDLESNRLDEADDQIDFGHAVSVPGTDIGAKIILDIAAVGVAVARRDPVVAETALRRLRVAQVEAGELPDMLARWCTVAQAEVCLLHGEPAAVSHMIADPGDETGYVAALERLVLAKARIALDQPAAALDALGPPRRVAAYRTPAVEAKILGAIAEDHLRRDASALEKITAAVDLAEPVGLIRPFLTAGDRVPVLLRRHQHVVARHRKFTDLVVAASILPPPSDAAPSVAEDPLTERELIVLRYLPTMFKASEIAADLFVSVNTVKTHQQSIYRKLSVTTRRDAVERARAMNLL